MGKPRKKSAAKVDSAPAVAAPPTKPMKKGKRDVEQVVEKQVVSSKKQKIVNGGVEQAVEKKKVDRKTRKKTKKEQTVSSEGCRSSESEEEQNKEQLESKEAASLMQEPTAGAKDGATTVPKNEPSDDSHSEDCKESSKGDTKEENSNVDSQPKNFPSGVVENGSVMTPVEEGKSKSSEGTSLEESGSGEEQVEVTPPKTSSAATTQDEKKASGSNEVSEEDVDDSSKEEDDQHLEPPKKSDTDIEMVDAASLKEKPQTPIPSQATGSKTVFMGNLSFSIEEDDVRNFFKDAGKIVAVRFAMREDRFAGYGHVEFSTAEAAQEALKRHNEVLLDRRVRLDLARERAAHPTTAPQATGSKTVYLGNLSFSIEEDDVKNFFKDVGEVAEVRFAMKDDRFMGFGHVEFTAAQAAQEALKLNNEVLLDRPVKLDLAKERGAYTPASREKSYQKGGQAQGKTVFVRGFDISDGFDNVRSKLEKHFGNCGEISRMSIPKDYESGAPKGVAFIDFADSNGFSQALELNGSDVGGRVITVEEAKPRSDSREGAGHGGGRGFGGGRSGGGGRFSGGRGGRGGRGRGPSRS